MTIEHVEDTLLLPSFFESNPSFLQLTPEERVEANVLIHGVVDFLNHESNEAYECGTRFPPLNQAVQCITDEKPSSREVERAIVAYFKHVGWSDVIMYTNSSQLQLKIY